jgi:hypothetical protein
MVFGAFGSIFFTTRCRSTSSPDPPHGIPELTAITLCAAGGLQLGAAVAVPGRHGRSQALTATSPALLLFVASLPPSASRRSSRASCASRRSATPRLLLAAAFAAVIVATLLVVRRFARAYRSTRLARRAQRSGPCRRSR